MTILECNGTMVEVTCVSCGAQLYLWENQLCHECVKQARIDDQLDALRDGDD